jgi:glutamate synthase domain-containing protein 3
MSGGVAYVYDDDGQFASRCNTSMVALDKVLSQAEQAAAGDAAGWHKSQADEPLLKQLIEDHHRWTGSLRARDILERWAEARGKFVKVFPHEYKRALEKRSAEKQSDATISKARGTQASTADAK